LTRSDDSSADEEESDSEESSKSESKSDHSDGEEESSEEESVKNVRARRTSKDSARRTRDNRNRSRRNTRRAPMIGRSRNNNRRRKPTKRLLTPSNPTSDNMSSLRKRSFEIDFEKPPGASPPVPKLGQKRILSEAAAILTGVVSDHPSSTEIGMHPFKVTRPAQNTQMLAEPSIFVHKSSSVSQVLPSTTAQVSFNSPGPSASFVNYAIDDQISLDSHAAVYLTKREETGDRPFDYNNREFQHLHDYLTELTTQLTQQLSEALKTEGELGSVLKTKIDQTLSRVREFVETCFLYSFEARDYLLNARLGIHVQNLLTTLKRMLYPRDLAFEEALSKIYAGLKPIANREFKLNRTEVYNSPPKVLHLPPSYFLVLITKEGHELANIRFAVIDRLRYRLHENVGLTPALSFVVAVDIEKEAFRRYPQLEAQRQYRELVKELLSEIRVSCHVTSEQQEFHALR